MLASLRNIPVQPAHFWDLTAVAAADRVVLKFRREGTTVEIIGLNEASATLVGSLPTDDRPGASAEPALH